MAIVAIVLTIFAAEFVEAQAQMVFQMDDPSGDDHGYGTYQVLPENQLDRTGRPSALAAGVWDLLHFEVSKSDENAIFKFRFRDLGKNVWGGPSGFSFQMILVCIDTDRVKGSGSTETLFNVKVHPANAWEYMLGIGGGWTDFTNSLYHSDGTVDTYKMGISREENTIIARVPKSIIGEPNENWAYTVLVWSEDTGRVRSILPENLWRKWEDAWGADPEAIINDVIPYVFDMLVPPGAAQEKILKGYNVKKGPPEGLATVYAVGPRIEGLPTEKEEEKPTPVIAIVAIVAAIVLVTAVVLITLKKRKRGARTAKD